MARILLFCLLLVSTSVRAVADVTIDNIEAAWEARQAKVQSFEATLKEERLLFQGSLNKKRRDPKLPGDVPQEDITMHREHCYIVAPNGSRMENEGTNFNTSTEKTFTFKTTSVMGDLGYKKLNDYGPHSEKDRRYLGILNEKKRGITDTRFIPLDQLVDKDFFFSEQEWGQFEIEKQSEIANDRPCVLLTNGTWKLWYDKERDFILVRFNVNDRYMMDIEYQKNETVKWLPSKWKSTAKGPAPEYKLRRITQMQLVDIQFNQTYADEIFQIEFPPETCVFDDTRYARTHDK